MVLVEVRQGSGAVVQCDDEEDMHDDLVYVGGAFAAVDVPVAVHRYVVVRLEQLLVEEDGDDIHENGEHEE